MECVELQGRRVPGLPARWACVSVWYVIDVTSRMVHKFFYLMIFRIWTELNELYHFCGGHNARLGRLGPFPNYGPMMDLPTWVSDWVS